jgi:hypothetical protein
MPAQPFTRRARWIGGAFALAVLAIRTRFIVAAPSSARPAFVRLELAWPHLAFATHGGGARAEVRWKVVP